MRVDLSYEEASVLRDVLQEKVTELDKEINRADSLRYKEQLRTIERTLERILGSVSAESARPENWEQRDAVPDTDAGVQDQE